MRTLVLTKLPKMGRKLKSNHLGVWMIVQSPLICGPATKKYRVSGIGWRLPISQVPNIRMNIRAGGFLMPSTTASSGSFMGVGFRLSLLQDLIPQYNQLDAALEFFVEERGVL